MQNIIKREDLDVIFVVVFATIAFTFLFWYNWSHPKLEIRYDCSIAEISPDYPVQVKEGCRKLRAEKILQLPK